MTEIRSTRRIISITFVLAIAAVHTFRLGSYLSGDMYTLYYSYASDIMIPFAAYFLLTLNDPSFRFLQHWATKAVIVFGVMTFSEIMQLFGFYFFGATFDLMDILMFAIGAILAVLADRQLLKRFVAGW